MSAAQVLPACPPAGVPRYSTNSIIAGVYKLQHEGLLRHTHVMTILAMPRELFIDVWYERNCCRFSSRYTWATRGPTYSTVALYDYVLYTEVCRGHGSTFLELVGILCAPIGYSYTVHAEELRHSPLTSLW